MWHEMMSCNLTQNNACDMNACNLTHDNDMKWCHVIWHKIMHMIWNDVM